MLLGDRQLVVCRVAVEIDDLHTVQQRRRDRFRRVRRANEEHIRQIIWHIQIMVHKIAVLLRIQHLQQRARRIAVVRRRKLVHLVQHHHRIRHPSLVDAVDDAPSHRANVGAAMPADIRLIAHTTQAHAHILAPQSPRNALAHRRFPRARRPHKEQDRAALFFAQRHHRDLLDHARLHLFQTIVVLIKDRFRRRHIDRVRFFLLPWQGQQIFQIIVEQRILIAAIFARQTVQHLVRLSARQIVQRQRVDQMRKAVEIVRVLRMHLIQLLLQHIDLTAQRLLLHIRFVFLALQLHRLRARPRHLNEGVDDLLDRLHAPAHARIRQHLIARFIVRSQPWRQRDPRFLDRMEALDHRHRLLAPVVFLGKIVQRILDRPQARQTLLLRHIAHIDEPRRLHLDRRVVVHTHRIDAQTLVGADRHKTILRHIAHISANADLVEIVRRVCVARLLFLRRQQHHILVQHRF